MAFSTTRNVYIQGKAKWAKLVTPDTKYNCWSVVVYPNEDSMKILNELKETKGETSGILNPIKKDEDGYNITLKRPIQKLMGGKVTSFAPPIVLEADGENPLRNALVGNGSDITCKVQVYNYNKPTGGKGTAIRLESVRVDNLVPFEIRRDFDKDQTRQVTGLQEAPPQPLF